MIWTQHGLFAGHDIVDNDLLHPGVIFVPVACANGVNIFIGTFDIAYNVPSNITIEKYSLHPFFPSMLVLIHQVVVISNPVHIQIFFGTN